MIDFHSHILPGIDDGSRDEGESILLIKEAKEYGFNAIISTSHYALNTYEVPEYKRIELLENLKSDVEDIEIYLGSEIFITPNIMDLINEGKASKINNTQYILFELPLHHHYSGLDDLIRNLKDNNYKLVLAHPERYLDVQNDFSILYKWIDEGILLQANYASILGYYGFKAKHVVKRMLKENLVSFMGSDVHREHTIYPMIPKAMKKISKYVSDEYLKEITNDNAQKILNNQEI